MVSVIAAPNRPSHLLARLITLPFLVAECVTPNNRQRKDLFKHRRHCLRCHLFQADPKNPTGNVLTGAPKAKRHMFNRLTEGVCLALDQVHGNVIRPIEEGAQQVVIQLLLQQ